MSRWETQHSKFNTNSIGVSPTNIRPGGRAWHMTRFHFWASHKNLSVEKGWISAPWDMNENGVSVFQAWHHKSLLSHFPICWIEEEFKSNLKTWVLRMMHQGSLTKKFSSWWVLLLLFFIWHCFSESYFNRMSLLMLTTQILLVRCLKMIQQRLIAFIGTVLNLNLCSVQLYLVFS